MRYEHVYRPDEQFLREFGHGQAPGAAPEPGRVRLWPERHDRPIYLPVCLESFENLLCVVQHRRGGIEGKLPVWLELGVMPAAVAAPADGDHVIGEDLPESRRGEDLSAAARRHSGIRGTHVKTKAEVGIGGHRRFSF